MCIQDILNLHGTSICSLLYYFFYKKQRAWISFFVGTADASAKERRRKEKLFFLEEDKDGHERTGSGAVSHDRHEHPTCFSAYHQRLAPRPPCGAFTLKPTDGRTAPALADKGGYVHQGPSSPALRLVALVFLPRIISLCLLACFLPSSPQQTCECGSSRSSLVVAHHREGCRSLTSLAPSRLLADQRTPPAQTQKQESLLPPANHGSTRQEDGRLQ